MGVKDLWNILSPLSERKPLFEIQGKTIAIDLSCWVVDSQSVTDNMAQPKMYLRNLFFRTSYFLLHDIFPVFVLEGTAPSLKHKTIVKRNNIRHGNEERKKPQKGGRSHFNRVLKECEEMLIDMGITCVKSFGEAEAMCAYLNNDGLVDGCISQDSDCFLYGAKVVYRNFCTSTQANRTTSGGSIDEYSMEKIKTIFNLDRNKMIALALLCGCDYDEGINGVGKEAALKLFQVVGDDEILTRIKEWRSNSSKFKRMEIELANPDICTNCGHSGKMRSHSKIGCIDCGTSIKCNDSYKMKRSLISNELNIRKKALLVENFPNQEIIDEFLIRKGSVPSKLDLMWKKPIITKFISFMVKHVQWEEAYAFAKIFPLATRWQLTNLIEFPIAQRLIMPQVFIPDKIKKIRNIRSVASYEIIWQDKDNILEGLKLMTSDSDKENEEDEIPETLSELVSIEPQDIVLKCYPNIVEEFEISRNAKKKKPTRNRRKEKNGNDDILTEKKAVQRKRNKSKSVEVKNNKKIIEFINVENHLPSLEESLTKLTITPKRRKKEATPSISNIKKRGPQFDKVLTTERMDSILNGSLELMFNELTPEDFPSDVENSMDMSIIINNICNKKRNQNNFFVKYQEHTDKSLQKSIKKDEIITLQREPLKAVDNLCDITRTSLTSISNKVEVDEVDEFDLLNKTYVPLDMRLNTENRGKKIVMHNSLTGNKSRGTFSFGIDSLLNATNE